MKENSNIVKSSVGKISKEKYEKMFKSNPNLKELIGQLNLSPINIEEEEKDDFDDYLIRKDLPF